MRTLREIMEAHPEWADLPIGIYQQDGSHHMLGELGSVYVYGDNLSKEEINDYLEELGYLPTVTLVFSGN